MSTFDITRARNAPFDAAIDAELMRLAEYITEQYFPPIQDYRDLNPGEPDTTGHLGPEATCTSLHFARPRYNLMVQMLQPLRGAYGVDISPAFGFLDVLLTESYGLSIVTTEHPQNFPAYGGLLRARGIEMLAWEIGRARCSLPAESQDFVIFAEVLEHLKMPPQRVLAQVSAPLKRGGTLLLTTPNIARQSNIDRLERGENILEPFRDYIPEDRDVTDYVSHIREYTVQEVVDLVEEQGLRVTDLAMCNWMDVPFHPEPLRNHYTCLLAVKER